MRITKGISGRPDSRYGACTGVLHLLIASWPKTCWEDWEDLNRDTIDTQINKISYFHNSVRMRFILDAFAR